MAKPKATRKADKGKKPASPVAKPAVGSEVLSSVLPQPEMNSKGKMWCPLANEGVGEWRQPTPEEIVRQGFVLLLNQHYGYSFDQMRQERKTQSGRRSPRVDIVIWSTPNARLIGESPKIVVECKAQNITIHPRDYYQGESYSRAVGAEILVMHNERQTSIFQVVHNLPGELVPINLVPKAEDWSDAKRIEEIKTSTRAFSRDEFRSLLFRCHSILRDVHKMEPGKAFDAISKILFVKMFIERTGSWGTFTTDFLRERNKTRLQTDDPVHVQLFEQTKRYFKDDELFSKDDRLDEISEETFKRIVKELERFNLSATGEDVKGIAFEKFLGDTFRGELGQFFTPRTVVDFMVQLLDPEEGHFICDPCAGSGGFLIRTFEHLRSKIEEDIQNRKDVSRAEIEALGLPEDEEEARIDDTFAQLNLDLEPEQADPPSRVHTLGHKFIFGTDAEVRAARTSKMNMIMHGDGHGGIHYHDGLLDINGIYPARFDIVFTNPPFGSNVGEDQKVGSTEQTRIPASTDYIRHCQSKYGDSWRGNYERMLQASRSQTPILELYEIGKDKPNRATEIVFVERCLSLLKPGGRMGVVLPDGNLNNPSLSWLRRWAEGKARLLAVISLPEDTFKSSDASVKASLVFLQRYTSEEEATWDLTWYNAHSKYDPIFAARRDELCASYGPRIASADDDAAAELLTKLAALEVTRNLPEWRLKPPPPYPRGVVQSEIGKPKWEGTPATKDAKQKARILRASFDSAWTTAHEERSEELRRELRTSLRKIDREHSRTLWAEVRTALDYPVFTAAPEVVGITSTGASGPNRLPQVLEAWRVFDAWVKSGAKQDSMPIFEL